MIWLSAPPEAVEQSASDSAALAGAAVTRYNGNSTAAARQDSSLNGFTHGTNSVTVTVNAPPTSGPNSGKSLDGKPYVEVLVSAVQPTFFMRIFGVNSSTVSARAVAVLSGGGTEGCMYTLERDVTGTTTNGTGSISAPNCGIIDDGSLRKNGSGSITAASIGVAGTVTDNGSGGDYTNSNLWDCARRRSIGISDSACDRGLCGRRGGQY